MLPAAPTTSASLNTQVVQPRCALEAISTRHTPPHRKRLNVLYFRLTKCAKVLAYAGLFWLTWQLIAGNLDFGFTASALLVSGMWLVLTRLSLRRLFDTYADLVSRIRIVVPFFIGLSLSVIAFLGDHSSAATLVFAPLLWLAWLRVGLMYRSNRKRYMQQGHGPLPKGTVVNPPMGMLQPLDLILTTGNAANTFHEPVSHAELVVRAPDGKMMAFSSYFRCGATINPLSKICHIYSKPGKHYIVLRPTVEISPEQHALAYPLSQIMLQQNEQYRQRARATRDRILNALPLPRRLREWLRAKFPVTGYSFLGLFIGRRAPDHWTCIGSAVELYSRLGISLRFYREGLLGLGTGIADPIQPVKFLDDPSLHLLNEDDLRAWQAQQEQQEQAGAPSLTGHAGRRAERSSRNDPHAARAPSLLFCLLPLFFFLAACLHSRATDCCGLPA
jgi:hypothetical protein